MTVKISKLTKIYGQGQSAVVALNELDLELEKNEICIVRGPNGSGKTTLISILAGQLDATAGTISLLTASNQIPRISVINQFHNLLNELTVKEHFEMLGNLKNLNLVPFEILNRLPTEISRGQAQLAAIALALSPETDLLLADEPTGALGNEDSERVYKLIKQAAIQNDSAVILVTHDAKAEAIADRVVRLRDGRISETWLPNQSEKQVISDHGWVKLPSEVLDGLNDSVKIGSTGDGASLVGRIHPPKLVSNFLAKREQFGTQLIEVRNLIPAYGQKDISCELNFSIKKNEVFCIFGKSGVGKTTVLKCLSGLHSNYQGQISITNKLPYFNIENLYGLELALNELIPNQELLAKLGLHDLAERKLKTLSGGQQQRALVAIALSAPSPIIILDEPTSALDDEMSEVVIRAILESEKTIVLATHDGRLLAVSNTVLNI